MSEQGGPEVEYTGEIDLTFAGNEKTGAPPRTVRVKLGPLAQIAAKRRLGMEAVRQGDPEATLFGAYVELEGPRPKTEQPEKFDKWLASLSSFEMVTKTDEESDDDEDPSPAESSAPLLASPPTPESTRAG